MKFMALDHEFYMKRCLELAASGIGSVAPNPMVGAVIVHNGKVIGEGYHRSYGEAHAEVHAIQSVADKTMLKESTLYVNLEPCAHQGKTPPCSDLIVRCGIPRVLIGTTDPNPLVAGKGIEILKKAKCEVIQSILPIECKELNKRFFTFQEKQRPYIILKWAETADHFIDKQREVSEKPIWITNYQSRVLVHKWRSEEQSIMIGTNTALMDNPQLNVREWSGKNPLRIVLDNKLRLPTHLHIFDGSQPTLVYTSRNEFSNLTNVKFINVDFEHNVLLAIMRHLYESKIISLFVEGGNRLLTSLIELNLWDEARVFKGNMLFHNGIPAPKINLPPMNNQTIENVNLKIFRNIH
jgi:diaminohydroxyphosphoribosylaminopyrimidine deaminase / 5-amino-6-(5-phosphoribosylamino)uracil reductase